MAKVTGPFMSIDSSGTAFGALTASIWKGRNYIRDHVRPTNPKTNGQDAQRYLFADAVSEWHGLYDATKEQWALAARECSPPISGFNYWVMQYSLQGGTPTIPAVAPKSTKTLHGRNSYGI